MGCCGSKTKDRVPVKPTNRSESTKRSAYPLQPLSSSVIHCDPPFQSNFRNHTARRTSEKRKQLRVLCDFPGGYQKGNKSIAKNEIVTLVSEPVPGNCRVRCANGNELQVPKSIISEKLTPPVTTQDWYFENISRDQCARILISGKKPGTFMIRPSNTMENCFSLSVLFLSDDIRHFLIRFENGSYCMDRNRFNSLEDLVNYHRCNLGPLKHLLTQHPRRQMPTIFALDDDAWVLDSKMISNQKLVGQGEYGDVYKAVYNNCQVVAVKTLKDQSKVDHVKSFLMEAELMKKLKHERLVNLLGIVINGEKIMIVTEFIHFGSLLRFLRNERQIKNDILLEFCVQIAEGMMFLEKNLVIHCDLAARNVLVDENLFCKISDFGMTKVIEGEMPQVDQFAKLPIKWSSPEVLIRSSITTKADVWSYGIVMFEIITHGQPPYGSLKNSEVTELVLNRAIMEKPDECPDHFYNLMTQCWAFDPDERPTFEKIHSDLKILDKIGNTYYK